MAHPNKDIEITNIKRYLTHEYAYLLFGKCTPKQRRVAEILEQAIWDINKIHKEWVVGSKERNGDCETCKHYDEPKYCNNCYIRDDEMPNAYEPYIPKK